MQVGKLPEVAKDTKIYVYCQSGNRSSQAVKILTDAGYANVSDLGGLQDVQANGGKLE
jgi:phage shock protein E